MVLPGPDYGQGKKKKKKPSKPSSPSSPSLGAGAGTGSRITAPRPPSTPSRPSSGYGTVYKTPAPVVRPSVTPRPPYQRPVISPTERVGVSTFAETLAKLREEQGYTIDDLNPERDKEVTKSFAEFVTGLFGEGEEPTEEELKVQGGLDFSKDRDPGQLPMSPLREEVTLNKMREMDDKRSLTELLNPGSDSRFDAAPGKKDPSLLDILSGQAEGSKGLTPSSFDDLRTDASGRSIDPSLDQDKGQGKSNLAPLGFLGPTPPKGHPLRKGTHWDKDFIDTLVSAGYYPSQKYSPVAEALVAQAWDRSNFLSNKLSRDVDELKQILQEGQAKAFEGDFTYVEERLKEEGLSLSLPQYRHVSGITSKFLNQQMKKELESAGGDGYLIGEIQKKYQGLGKAYNNMRSQMQFYRQDLKKAVRKHIREVSKSESFAKSKGKDYDPSDVLSGIPGAPQFQDKKNVRAQFYKMLGIEYNPDKKQIDFDDQVGGFVNDDADEFTRLSRFLSPKERKEAGLGKDPKNVSINSPERWRTRKEVKNQLGMERLPTIEQMLEAKAWEGQLDLSDSRDVDLWIKRFRNPNHPQTLGMYASFGAQEHDDPEAWFEEVASPVLNKPYEEYMAGTAKEAAEIAERNAQHEAENSIFNQEGSGVEPDSLGGIFAAGAAGPAATPGGPNIAEGGKELFEPGVTGLMWTFDKMARPLYTVAAMTDAVYSMDNENNGPAWWMRAFDPLSNITGQSVFSSVDDLNAGGVKNIATAGKDQFFRGSGLAADAVTPMTFSNVIANAAEKNPENNWYDSNVYQEIAGFSADIMLDPLNFVGVGVLGASTKAAKGLRGVNAQKVYEARQASYGAKIPGDETPDLVGGLSPAVVRTLEAAEKSKGHMPEIADAFRRVTDYYPELASKYKRIRFDNKSPHAISTVSLDDGGYDLVVNVPKLENSMEDMGGTVASQVSDDKSLESIFVHEFAHVAHREFGVDATLPDIPLLSKYAETNDREKFAEWFTSHHYGMTEANKELDEFFAQVSGSPAQAQRQIRERQAQVAHDAGVRAMADNPTLQRVIDESDYTPAGFYASDLRAEKIAGRFTREIPVRAVKGKTHLTNYGGRLGVVTQKLKDDPQIGSDLLPWLDSASSGDIPKYARLSKVFAEESGLTPAQFGFTDKDVLRALIEGPELLRAQSDEMADLFNVAYAQKANAQKQMDPLLAKLDAGQKLSPDERAALSRYEKVFAAAANEISGYKIFGAFRWLEGSWEWTAKNSKFKNPAYGEHLEELARQVDEAQLNAPVGKGTVSDSSLRDFDFDTIHSLDELEVVGSKQDFYQSVREALDFQINREHLLDPTAGGMTRQRVLSMPEAKRLSVLPALREGGEFTRDSVGRYIRFDSDTLKFRYLGSKLREDVKPALRSKAQSDLRDITGAINDAYRKIYIQNNIAAKTAADGGLSPADLQKVSKKSQEQAINQVIDELNASGKVKVGPGNSRLTINQQSKVQARAIRRKAQISRAEIEARAFEAPVEQRAQILDEIKAVDKDKQTALKANELARQEAHEARKAAAVQNKNDEFLAKLNESAGKEKHGVELRGVVGALFRALGVEKGLNYGIDNTYRAIEAAATHVPERFMRAYKKGFDVNIAGKDRHVPGLVRPSKQVSPESRVEAEELLAIQNGETPMVIRAILQRIDRAMADIPDEAIRRMEFGRYLDNPNSPDVHEGVKSTFDRIETIWNGKHDWYKIEDPISGTYVPLGWEDLSAFMKDGFRPDFKTLHRAKKDHGKVTTSDLMNAIKVRNKAEGRSNPDVLKDPHGLAWHLELASSQAVQQKRVYATINDTFGLKREANFVDRKTGEGRGFTEHGQVIEQAKDAGWITIPELGHTHYFPKEMAEDLRAMLAWTDPSRLAELKWVDTAIGYWKQGMTIYNPGYYTRNGIGEIMVSWMDGVNSPKWYAKSKDIINYMNRTDQDLASIIEQWGVLGGKLPTNDVKGGKVLGELKGGLKYTVADVHQAAIRHGIMSTFFNTDLGGSAVRQMGGSLHTGGSKLRRGVRKANEQVHQTGEHFEDWLRLAHFMHAMEKSGRGTIDAAATYAAKRVRRSHFDYTDFSDMEKAVLGRAFPFFKWTRRGAPLMVAHLFMTPGKMVAPVKAMDTTSGLFSSKDVNEDPNGILPNYDGIAPQWVVDLFAYQMGPAPDDEYGDYFRLATPQVDALGAATMPFENAVLPLMNPAARIGGEQILNKSLDPDFPYPIRGGEYNEKKGITDLEASLSHASKSVNPWTKFIDKMIRDKYSDREWSMNEGGYEKSRDVLSHLTGLGFYQGMRQDAFQGNDERSSGVGSEGGNSSPVGFTDLSQLPMFQAERPRRGRRRKE